MKGTFVIIGAFGLLLLSAVHSYPIELEEKEAKNEEPNKENASPVQIPAFLKQGIISSGGLSVARPDGSSEQYALSGNVKFIGATDQAGANGQSGLVQKPEGVLVIEATKPSEQVGQPGQLGQQAGQAQPTASKENPNPGSFPAKVADGVAQEKIAKSANPSGEVPAGLKENKFWIEKALGKYDSASSTQQPPAKKADEQPAASKEPVALI